MLDSARVTVVGAGALFALWLVLGLMAHLTAWHDRGSHDSVWYRQPANNGSGLVVIAHGWTKGPDNMAEVAAVVAGMKEFQGCGIFLWGYNSERFSNENPDAFAHDLTLRLEELHRRNKGEIVLIGHSLGGLLVRRAFVNAIQEKRSWMSSVSRIVLLAAPNRGTEATSRSPLLWVSDALAKSYGLGQLIRSIYRGSPFIDDLQIDWSRQVRSLPHPPVVVQITGGNDKVVTFADSRDTTALTERQLPDATHESIVKMTNSGSHLRDLLSVPRSPKPKAI